jgi:hypothetical protein
MPQALIIKVAFYSILSHGSLLEKVSDKTSKRRTIHHRRQPLSKQILPQKRDHKTRQLDPTQMSSTNLFADLTSHTYIRAISTGIYDIQSSIG